MKTYLVIYTLVSKFDQEDRYHDRQSFDTEEEARACIKKLKTHPYRTLHYCTLTTTEKIV